MAVNGRRYFVVVFSHCLSDEFCKLAQDPQTQPHVGGGGGRRGGGVCRLATACSLSAGLFTTARILIRPNPLAREDDDEGDWTFTGCRVTAIGVNVRCTASFTGAKTVS